MTQKIGVRLLLQDKVLSLCLLEKRKAVFEEPENTGSSLQPFYKGAKPSITCERPISHSCSSLGLGRNTIVLTTDGRQVSPALLKYSNYVDILSPALHKYSKYMAIFFKHSH